MKINDLVNDCTGILTHKQACNIYFDLALFSALWHNTLMSRWMLFFIVILIGAAIGMVYGWMINPVEYVDNSPDALREDYKTDYVLMVAETFHAEANIGLAARRLAMLGDDQPIEIVTRAIQYGEQNHYSAADLSIMSGLQEALRTWNPSLEIPAP